MVAFIFVLSIIIVHLFRTRIYDGSSVPTPANTKNQIPQIKSKSSKLIELKKTSKTEYTHTYIHIERLEGNEEKNVQPKRPFASDGKRN